ncbi:MAG: class I SAM-dependent methyltransferase [Umezawaea sp.]
MTDPNRLRGIFGEDAELYDRCRPGYPREVVADLASLAGPGARVLEIGSGTGQATLPMTRLGWAVTGVELDANMAAVARRNAPEADVVVSAFEDWEPPATPFDLVVAATAFHWVDPEVRVVKAADVLRPGGSLVVISTHHVLGGTEEFFTAAQRCYERFDPATPPDLRLEPSSAIPEDSAEFDDSGRFGPVSFRRHEWELTYTAAGYLDLLSTYSGHRALPADARDGLFRCIAGLIDDRHGGRITKRFMTQLAITARGSR